MLEVVGVPAVLEQVDLGQQLLLFLLQLCDFLFQLCWVHTILAKGLGVGMHSLELRLQVLVDLECVAHVLVVHILVRDLKGYQELGSVRLSSEVW